MTNIKVMNIMLCIFTTLTVAKDIINLISKKPGRHRREKKEFNWSNAIILVPNPPYAGCCAMIYITVMKKQNKCIRS